MSMLARQLWVEPHQIDQLSSKALFEIGFKFQHFWNHLTVTARRRLESSWYMGSIDF